GPYREGDAVTLTVSFTEAMQATPALQLSGAMTLAQTQLTKANETQYTHTLTVTDGNGTANAILHAQDPAGNAAPPAPTSGTNFTLDNTVPTGSLAVFRDAASTEATHTNSTSVTVRLAAQDDFTVTGYYVSEADTTPLQSDFTTVALPATNFSKDIAFDLASGEISSGAYTCEANYNFVQGIGYNQHTVTSVGNRPGSSWPDGAAENALTECKQSCTDSNNCTGIALQMGGNANCIKYHGDLSPVYPGCSDCTGWGDGKKRKDGFDAGSQLCFKGANVAFVSDGLKTVHGWALDKTGNIGGPYTDTITLDTVPPTLTLSDLPDEYTNADSLSVSVTLSETADVLKTGTCGLGSFPNQGTGT
ncbi:MAG: hypothetical protein VYC68_01715, partial [Candidatus Thermoplasmatota archaeon]|nr:hypothetical protein [Candidatus Thermoplasmatota archaeon]